MKERRRKEKEVVGMTDIAKKTADVVSLAVKIVVAERKRAEAEKEIKEAGEELRKLLDVRGEVNVVTLAKRILSIKERG